MRSKQEAEKVWEPKFIGEIVAGKDPRRPPAPPTAEGMTVAEFLDLYFDRYVVAESLRSVASIRSRIGALKSGLGLLPVLALERIDPIEDFKREYGATKSTASVNRTLAILRHAINWGRGRTPAIFTTSPFHRFGVKIKTKTETKRDRRITAEEERNLLAAADKINCAEHGYAGALMRDRILGALETGCRLGEMLKIQNRHVLWETHQISIPAAHAKDAEARRIPFEPNGRLARLLKRRRFLGTKAYVFGGVSGEYQGTIRTAWESVVLLAHGVQPTRARAHGRVNREQLAEIDLHWHDLRHEAACRWLAKGLDLRAIQLLLGHADLKTPQRYLNVTDEELRRTMHEKLWSRRTGEK
ncbi:MAG TPA: tyrosine-type recombinase/integrase [Vicinamibacterales bacterium]|nr:tyrosine-type recombinase/integrase [Vicinamibacterales bacterium]